jgi:DNA-binding response OmpR family regulator
MDTLLAGKRILVVDDEPDILETVAEVLEPAQVVTSGNFEEARQRIETESFDLVILDIMGIDGFTLLKACRARRQPAAMLTAHALDAESLHQSVELGAVSFLPKEELHRLPEIVAEILEGLAQGQTHWARLFQRLGTFFKEKLGVLWEDDEENPKFPRVYY